jgi:hypothetical protein
MPRHEPAGTTGALARFREPFCPRGFSKHTIDQPSHPRMDRMDVGNQPINVGVIGHSSQESKLAADLSALGLVWLCGSRRSRLIRAGFRFAATRPA